MPRSKAPYFGPYLEAWGNLPAPNLYVPMAQGDAGDKASGLVPVTQFGTTWAPGPWGPELSFSSGLLGFPPLNSGSSLSIVGLVSLSGGSGTRTILSKRNASTVVWVFRVSSTGNLELLAGATNCTTTLALTSGAYHAVGVVVPGASSNPVFYRLDGSGLTTQTSGSTANLSTSNNTVANQVGAHDNSGAAGAPWSGRISAAAWWNAALTSDQMATVLADLWNGAFSPVRPRDRAVVLISSLSSGPVVRTGSATLSGVASLSSGRLAIRTRSATLAGTASLSSGRLAIRTRSSSLSGAGSLSATGQNTTAGLKTGSVSLAGAGSLSVSGRVFLHVSGGTLAGIASVSATGLRVGSINTLEERITDVLRSNASLVTLVGARIFESERPEGAGLPAVVWTVDRRGIEDLDGPTGLVEATIGLEAQAVRRSTSRQVAGLLRSSAYLLEASPGPIVQAVVVDDDESDSDSFEDGSGRLVYFDTVTARAWVRES